MGKCSDSIYLKWMNKGRMEEEEMVPIAIEGKRVYWMVAWGVGVLV